MRKPILLLLTALSILFNSYAQEIDSNDIWIQQIQNSLNFEKGEIILKEANAKLTVPNGFGYLNKEESIYVLTKLWGNPPDSSVLGMLVPENRRLLDANGWAFTINYDEIGYVKDDDADDIDYKDLLADMQKESEADNAQRVKDGYQAIQLVGWASTPFYDKDKKVLHWAKELKFGTDSLNTLNYNLRILGKKGIFIINAIATTTELNEVRGSIGKVVNGVQFNEGSKYANFDSKTDNIAAITIGGLVAGKILAKVGFFALLLKFWKLIGLAIIGGGAAIVKFFKGKKEKETAIENRD